MSDVQNYEIISPEGEASSALIEVVTKAEIDMQISTAKKFPRSIKQFVNEATEMVTLSESVAQSCNYGLPRGGKIIEGPSVRFAEIILSAWGNSRAGARVVHEDARFVTAQGVCHDMQRNSMITMEVKRRITDKNGKTYIDDMIGVTGNAAASIALRNAILRTVPKAFWEPIYQKSRSVALGESKPMANRRADALEVMQKFGVSLEMILAKFEIQGVEDLTIDHLHLLNAAKTSIKEGISTAEELFSLPTQADDSKGTNAVKEKLREKKAKKAGANPETGELPPEAGDVGKKKAAPKAAPAPQGSPESAESTPAATTALPDLSNGPKTFMAADALMEDIQAAPQEEKAGFITSARGQAVLAALRGFGYGMKAATIEAAAK